MYGLSLTLRASAALTFRVLPSGILDIITYPFVPPTTLSGWLRRLWMLAEGYDLPGTTAVKNAPYYVLPRELISLGAYPTQKSHIHKTKRKGVKDFRNTSFTRLVFDKQTGPTFQLHSWEYLTTDKLTGYLVSEERALLDHLREVLCDAGEAEPWGCKLGKEGFAYLTDLSEVEKLEQQRSKLMPQTLLPVELLVEQDRPIDFSVFNIYRFAWEDSAETKIDEPSPVAGYDILPLAQAAGSEIEGLWWQGEGLRFPVGLEEMLGGVYGV